MPSDKQIVEAIIKRHGTVIDLEKQPGVIIDIIRRFADDPDGGDQPCSGVPTPPPSPSPSGQPCAGSPTPPPSPSPSPSGSRIETPATLDELLHQVTELRTQVNSITQHLGVNRPGR